ncbi:MAG TPA: hypothetical protein PKV23_09440, partial [Aestuariivirga sp.]|nr:hypothetical protein [Aestuariivirga sp.]
MTAIMPLQGFETNHSGWIAATGLRLVRARPTIVVGARAMLLLLPTNTSATTTGPATRLAVRHGVAALTAATVGFIAGDTVTRSELNFELDDFVPLFVGSI